MAEKQAGFTVTVENQDLKGFVNVPNALETEAEKWITALNAGSEVKATGVSYWHSEDGRELKAPNGTEIATHRRVKVRYTDNKKPTFIDGKLSDSEVTALKTMAGTIGPRTIDTVVDA